MCGGKNLWSAGGPDGGLFLRTRRMVTGPPIGKAARFNLVFALYSVNKYFPKYMEELV
jgi:hypothetical protein